jgi:hypothetical protein
VLALAQSGDEVLYCQLQPAWMGWHEARDLKDTCHSPPNANVACVSEAMTSLFVQLAAADMYKRVL